MSTEPILSGTIPAEGPGALLRIVERRKTTGVLRFESELGLKGELPLVRGEPGDGDALEAFLRVEAGRYAVHQRLPTLPVSRGDERARDGRLGAHAVADLLAFCEGAGLTGALFVRQEERHADFLYDAGELVAVRLFGDDDADVQEVFRWEEGTFRVEAWNALPLLPGPDTERPPRPSEIGPGRPIDSVDAHLLKVVEVTLASLVDDRARSQPPPPPPLTG